MMKITQALQPVGKLFRTTLRKFVSVRGLRLSAALSCYVLFSFVPLLFVIISVCGVFLGEKAVRGEVFDQIKELAGPRMATEIQQIIKSVKPSKDTSGASIIGIIFLVITASGVFAEIKACTNILWGLKPVAKNSLRKFTIRYLLAFAAIGLTALLLLVSLVINSLLELLDHRLILYLPELNVNFYYLLNLVILFALLLILFTIIFKLLNDGRPAIRACLAGGIFTAVLFMLGKFAVGLYLDHLLGYSVYGAMGTPLIVLGWLYYSCIVLYMGVAFTGAYAGTYGNGIKPGAHYQKV